MDLFYILYYIDPKVNWFIFLSNPSNPWSVNKNLLNKIIGLYGLFIKEKLNVKKMFYIQLKTNFKKYIWYG